MNVYDHVTLSTVRDFTTRWSCRRGDYLLWLRRGPMDAYGKPPQIIDLWQMPDGAFVTITNRWQDFPPWFDLHPLEVKNSLVPWMRKRIDADDYLAAPLDGPNIWRPKGGDRIVWIGHPRATQAGVNGVLGILECPHAVAVLADHPNGSMAFMDFTATPEGDAICRAGMAAERTLDELTVFDPEWKLG